MGSIRSMSSQIAVELDEQAVMLDVFKSIYLAISLYGSMGSILSMSSQMNKMTVDLSIWLFI